MWSMYAFIICAALSVVLIPVGLWVDNYNRKCSEAYKRSCRNSYNDLSLRAKAKRSMRMIEASNVIHGLAIVGTIVMFVWMMSTVVWDFLFTLAS